VVRVGDWAIAASRWVVMAGPCSVESREQIEQSAEIVARAGAKVIRGGASSRAARRTRFQGMGRRGCDCCAGGGSSRAARGQRVMDQTNPLVAE